MKRIISVLLTAVLMLSLIPAGAVEFAFSAQADSTEGYWTYWTSNGRAILSGVDPAISGDQVIPSKLGGYPVTMITSVFQNCKNLTGITIPKTVTSILSGAFYGCDALATIRVESGNPLYHSAGNCLIHTENKTLLLLGTNSTIPDDGSVTKIGERAFAGRKDLESIVIPDTVTEIEKEAFYQCYNLREVTIGDGVTSIGDGAFEYCSSLTAVTIPSGVTEIGTLAFSPNLLTSVEVDRDNAVYYSVNNCIVRRGTAGGTVILGSANGVLPDDGSIAHIDGYAFYLCDTITSVTIPQGVESIDESAFYGCRSLRSVTLPEGITYIGKEAFYNCTSLEVLRLPNSLQTIRDKAFYNCKSAVTVTIGPAVKQIGSDAFWGCTALREVHITDLAAWFAIPFYTGGANPLYLGAGLWLNGAPVTKLVVPDGVTAIGNYAFYGCSSITSLTVPNSVTSIGNFAFYKTSLESVALPNSVTQIGDSAFLSNPSLVAITMEAGGTQYHTAGNCLIRTAKKELIAGSGNSVIPDDGSVTSIGSSAFSGLQTLTSVVIPADVTSIGDYAFQKCESLTAVTMEEGIESIGIGAFYECTALEEITIPDSVTSIDQMAFYKCSALTAATVGNGVESMGQMVFYGCSSLNSLTLREGLGVIGALMFSHCASLAAVTIPSSVNSVANNAFSNCTALRTVTIRDGVEEMESYAFYNCPALISVSLPNSLLAIGAHAFNDCTALGSVTVPGNIKTLSTGVFKNCTSLWSVDFSAELEVIGNSAFEGCASLTALTIPNSVTTLGRAAFQNCTSLTAVTLGSGLNAVEYEAFAGCTALASLTMDVGIKEVFVKAFEGCTALADVYYYGTREDRSNMAVYDRSPILEATWHYIGEWTCKEHTYTDVNDNICDLCGSDRTVAYYIYTVADNEVTVKDVNTIITGDVVIPATLDGYPVTAIGDNAFRNCVNITEVTIPAGVESIGNYAFRNCAALQAVHYNAANCTKVGLAQYPAFADCPLLTTVYIGKEVTQIPANTFRSAEELTTVYITKNTKTIYANAFYQTALTDVYYVGTTSDSTAVDVRSYNTAFEEAVFGYNSPCFQGHEWTAECDEQCDLCNVKRAVTHTNIVTDAAVEPTCAAGGLTAGSHCAACGNVIEKQQFISAKGHKWVEDEVLSEPTANKNGSKRYVCTRCRKTKTVVLTLAEVRDGRYYYDGKIVADAGLVQVEDEYYYVSKGGEVKTGRYMVSNVNGLPFSRGIYYFFEDGRMNTTAGVYEGYYFNEQGKLTPYAGLIEWNTAKYYVNNGGAVNAGGFYYISNLNGLLPKACLRTFYPDGRMLEETRIYEVDGYYYENGARTPYAGMVLYSGNWYYVNDGGAYVKNKVQVLVNVNNSGLTKKRRCYFNADGYMVKNTIVNGAYYGADGMAPDYAGVVKVGNSYYYVGGTHGAVTKNKTVTISTAKTNGLIAAGKYTADANGKLTAV